MELGHLFKDFEQSPSLEQTEHRFLDLESERPSGIELPSLWKKETDNTEAIEWNSIDSERESVELPHIENGYYSTYEERIKQTPRENSERGDWSGERGESEFTPNSKEIKEILEKYGIYGISYKDGIPDFFEVSESTVQIENMTENRAENFKQCDEKCSEEWNQEGRGGRADWTARDVKVWRQENGYSWHERNDMKTCDLVPTKVNDYAGHLGGVSECKKRDLSESGGSDFDE